MNPEPDQERFHAFDALRGAMMLLGVVLHAACAYVTVRIPAVPYQDQSTSPLMDLLITFIHTFRLPLFFVMAGFFAALLAARKGMRGMVQNRVRRLLVPLLVWWPILAPLVVLSLIFAAWRHPDFALGLNRSPISSGPEFTEKDGLLMHLWFIYDLFLFCLAAAGLSFAAGRWAPALAAGVAKSFHRLFSSPLAPWVMGLITAATLLPMRHGSFDTSAWLLPPARILAAYFVFFAFGWLLFAERGRMHILRERCWARLLIGTLLMAPHLVGLRQMLSGAELSGGARLATALAGGLACWGIIFGITGLAMRWCEKPRVWARYLTDASYWIYLAHLPLVLFLHGLLAPYPLPALVKFAIVLLVATTVLVILYDLAVRDGRIGEQLNGARRPRLLLRRDPNRSLACAQTAARPR